MVKRRRTILGVSFEASTWASNSPLGRGKSRLEASQLLFGLGGLRDHRAALATGLEGDQHLQGLA
jgi:hypothetical protein